MLVCCSHSDCRIDESSSIPSVYTQDTVHVPRKVSEPAPADEGDGYMLFKAACLHYYYLLFNVSNGGIKTR